MNLILVTHIKYYISGPSPRGNSKPAKCLPAHDTEAPARLQADTGACLLPPSQTQLPQFSKGSHAPHTHNDLHFSTVRVLNGLWACRHWSPPHLEMVHSSFKKRYPILQETCTPLCSFKREVLSFSLSVCLMLIFLSFLLFYYLKKNIFKLTNDYAWYIF